MTVFAPTEVRLSEAARGCQRMSFLRAIGCEPREPDSEAREYFARGNLFEEYVVRQLIAKHGRDNVVRQYEVQHPLGTGHADALIKPDRLLVEIKSTTTGSISSPVVENGIRQLKLYLFYAQDVADEGALYVINPSTLKPADVLTVRLSDEDRGEIGADMLALAVAIENREIPDRVCSRPTQARGMFCPFADTCFEGWEPDPAVEVTSSDALAAASELAAIKANERTHKAALKALEEGRKDAESRLSQFCAVGKSVVGGFEVSRTHVRRRPSFSLTAYEAAGMPLEPLAEFFQPGAEYDTWSVKEAEFAGDVDFGEVPF